MEPPVAIYLVLMYRVVRGDTYRIGIPRSAWGRYDILEVMLTVSTKTILYSIYRHIETIQQYINRYFEILATPNKELITHSSHLIFTCPKIPNSIKK